MERLTLNTRKGMLRMDSPIVMGIINVTPDSFAVACRGLSRDEVLMAADRALRDGAAILDIGGYSTRPGADAVSCEEEWRRVELALRAITSEWPQAVVSVDTFRAEVARRACLEYGADIINDVSGGELDADMYSVVAHTKAAYVLMHMRGTPNTMQTLCNYEHLMADITDYFARKVDTLHQLGVSDIVLDPGFGFAKTLEQNYYLLRHLDELRSLDLPILAGLSRKSMIYRALDCSPQSDDALYGTVAAHMLALQGGAKILRVHDVRAAVRTINIYSQIKNV